MAVKRSSSPYAKADNQKKLAVALIKQLEVHHIEELPFCRSLRIRVLRGSKKNPPFHSYTTNTVHTFFEALKKGETTPYIAEAFAREAVKRGWWEDMKLDENLKVEPQKKPETRRRVEPASEPVAIPVTEINVSMLPSALYPAQDGHVPGHLEQRRRVWAQEKGIKNPRFVDDVTPPEERQR